MFKNWYAAGEGGGGIICYSREEKTIILTSLKQPSNPKETTMEENLSFSIVIYQQCHVKFSFYIHKEEIISP